MAAGAYPDTRTIKMHEGVRQDLTSRNHFRVNVVVVLLIWTAAIAAFASISYLITRDTVTHLAFTKARETFNKDQAFRLWATMHGGVYVPITATTPSNPYLSHLPERDIGTPTGRPLTLMNPAYMVRQLNEYYAELFGTHSHITSLNPLRPENLADSWESKALRQFEQGVQEVSEMVDELGIPYLRLMRPMVTEQGCLKCHAHQGYKVGDIRGGVSVKVPLQEFIDLHARQTELAVVGVPLLWAFGIIVILLYARAIRRAQKRRESDARRILRESTLNKAQTSIIKIFTEDSDIEDIAREVHQRALEVSGSQLCYISTIDPDTGHNVVHVTTPTFDESEDTPLAGPVVFSKGPSGYHGLWGHSLNSLEAFYTNDAASHPMARGVPPGHVPIRRFLSVPAAYGGQLLGQIALANAPRDYTERDLQDIQALASIYALGLYRMQIQNNLISAKEEAEIANRSKSIFLANMSHEIRTPLNGVLSLLQLMQTTPLTAEQTEYAEMAIGASNRLTRLLSDILDLSRVEANMLEMRNDPFDLAEAVATVEQLFLPAARQKGLDMRVTLWPEFPRPLCGDALRLQQVLSNLVGNAIKFTERGSVEIEAYPLPPRNEGDYRVLFSITDTGPGIPDDQIETLFESFTQLNQGYTRQAQGAGLGLAIVKQLVKLMGGNIAISSEMGEGTTVYFCCTLKMMEAQAATAQKTASQDTPTRLEVLLAEDDRTTLLATSRLLEKRGHNVTSVTDGAQALAALKTQSPDVILMDVQMPGMDGLEATRRIRAGEAGIDKRGIPVIALTAYAMADDEARFREAGMDDFLPKPVRVEDIEAAFGRMQRMKQP